MWALVGLGNPGRKYAGTRHNIGFQVVEELAARHNIALTEKTDYSLGEGSINGMRCLLVEPLTFMNRSGLAVTDLKRRHGFGPEELILIYDDMDIPTGRLKLRPGGSSGGHRGVESVIASLGTMEFHRVKVGIGRTPDTPAEIYVLQKFRPEEKVVVAEAVHEAADAVEGIMGKGMAWAMNAFNRKQ